MSEYQAYEFFALDRPLTPTEMGELRGISARAEISPTRFWNEYQWGSPKADPVELLARYFDAFLYFSSWASHRFMLRLPASRVDIRQLKAYFPGGPAKFAEVGDCVVLELWSRSEEPERDWSKGGRLGALVPLRVDLLQGDMSAAYLAWLLAVQAEHVPASSKEPRVPPGLRHRGASLTALMEFLRIDQDLVAAAAEGCSESDLDQAALRKWVQSLPAKEKDRWLTKAVGEPTIAIGTDLIAAFRRKNPVGSGRQRTVSALLARAETLRTERQLVEAKRAAEEQVRAEAARKKHLSALSKQGDKAWSRLDRLVESREYDEAVKLTVELRDAALAVGCADDFDGRLVELRKRHARRRGYLDAVKRQLGASPTGGRR